MPRVTALAGGVGAARMLAGLASVVGQAAITAVVNTGDDTRLHGLYVCPDLDTVCYTLAGAHNLSTGWGLAGETWAVMDALAAFEKIPAADGSAETLALTWFRLGDRDLATHLYRTGRLAAGLPLSQVTAEICGRFGVEARLLPMSDDRVETRLVVPAEQLPPVPVFGGLDRSPGASDAGGGQPSAGGGEIRFQEYFVGLRHSVEVSAVRFAGAAEASPAPGVLESLEQGDVVVICPSNPVVSIGPVLAVPGIAQALARRRADVVAVSPIIAGRALKGPADRMLAELGHEASAAGIATLWAPYAGTLVIDEVDAGLADRVEAAGMHCVVAPTVMSGPAEAAQLARTVLGSVPAGAG